LEDELNDYLAREYEVKPTHKAEYQAWLASHKPFHWFIEFYGIMKSGGFNVIIGNPPYVELKVLTDYQLRGYHCTDCGNLYAVMLERGRQLGDLSGWQGFIVPVSSVSTDRYVTLQKLLVQRQLYYSSYDDRPSRLFDGLEHARLTIHIIGHYVDTPTLWSTRYNKWTASERAHLFGCLRYVRAEPLLVPGTLPKLTSKTERGILEKLLKENACLGMFYSAADGGPVFYSRKVGYFLQVLDFEPEVYDAKRRRRPPSEFKRVDFPSDSLSRVALCCLNSSLFYWFITAFSDCRHVNKREVDAFPVQLKKLAESRLASAITHQGKALMADLKTNSEKKVMRFSHDTLTVQCIFPKASKPIIDEIDQLLAKHYGFTEEELDFIINYDIKYRMGREAEEADE
jgi:hypothetical protein